MNWYRFQSTLLKALVNFDILMLKTTRSVFCHPSIFRQFEFWVSRPFCKQNIQHTTEHFFSFEALLEVPEKDTYCVKNIPLCPSNCTCNKRSLSNTMYIILLTVVVEGFALYLKCYLLVAWTSNFIKTT